MIPQSALILTSGLIFLFFFSPSSEKLYVVNPFLSAFLILFLTIAPCVLLYSFGRIGIARYIRKFRRFNLLMQNPIRYGLPFGILALGGFVTQVYYLQTPIVAKKYLSFLSFENIRTLVCVIPLVISIILNRLTIFELNRLIHNDSSTRRDFIMPDLKLMFIPAIPFIASLFISDLIDNSPLRVRIFFIKQSYIYWLIILLIALIKSSFFIRRIWKTESLPDGEIRSRIESFARKVKIKYRDILVWNISNKNIANAGVAGLLPNSRYIFITSSLLYNLNIDEIEAIVAHEFGHIKHRHILAYMVFSFGYLVFFSLLYAIFYPVIKEIQFGTIISALLGALATLAVFFIYFVFIFRYFSRRFERQADLYAVSVTGNPEAFKNALTKVASINYMPMQVPRFVEIFRTHPSVYERLRLIDRAMVGDPDALRYANSIIDVRKATAILAVIVLILGFAKRNFLFPPGEIHYEIGRQYAIEGMLDAAISEFDKAVVSDPKSADAVYALGLLYAEKGAVDRAENQFKRVLEINPKNNSAREKLEQIQNKKE
jgi:Zn-dependent protease with chaperone function